MKKTLLATLAMAAALCAMTASAETVQIASAADWATFANRVNTGETTLNAEMTDDVTLSNDSPRVGDAEAHPYGGIFDGNRYTLTLNWNKSGVKRLAPFAYVSGCTIHDLHVSGSIESDTDTDYVAGLIGCLYRGDVTVERCRCSVSFTVRPQGDHLAWYSGGFFASADYSNTGGITLRDCLFDGSFQLPEVRYYAGFGSCLDDTFHVSVYNSLFAPSSLEVTLASPKSWCCTIAGPGANINMSAVYRTQTFGEEQGIDASSMSAADLVAALGSNWVVADGKPMLAPFVSCSLTFASDSEEMGTSSFRIGGNLPPTAPIAPRHGDDRFLGYFTAQSGGEKVYDENYEYVQGSSWSPVSDATLYAQWQPVVKNLEGGITRLVYRGVLTNFGEWSSGLNKTMHVKVYDSASAATPLWSGDAANVPINPDGSFEAVFGNDELALAFASNNVTHVELTVGDSLSPLAPRRSFASIASVNRALVAEGAASDIKVGTLGANAIVAEKITAGSLEASEMVRVEGSVSVEVKPFDIGQRQETTIWRGAGVSAWGDSKFIKKVDNVVAGQWLWTSDREGVVMIHATGKSRSTLRIPATIQFVRPGDEVRAPTWENGEVSVTVWGYKR